MKKIILVLVFFFLFSPLVEAKERIRKGLQRNIPIYAQVLGRERADQLLTLINRGEIGGAIVPKGIVGDNYFVSESGQLMVIRDYQCLYDRPARLVDGVIFFTTCDNLFIPKQVGVESLPKPAPSSPPQKLDIDLEIEPIEVKTYSAVNLEVKPLQVDLNIKIEPIKIEGQGQQAQPNITINNIMPAPPIPYAGPLAGTPAATVVVTGYQAGSVQQVPIYNNQITTTVVGGSPTATATGGSASATGGNSTVTVNQSQSQSQSQAQSQ